MEATSVSKKMDTEKTSGWVQSASFDGILALSIEDVIAKLGTSPSGLTSREARSRLETYGYNELPRRRDAFMLRNICVPFIGIEEPEKKQQEKMISHSDTRH
jgi:magnesium-transporting ATPase (P-type)